MAKKAKEKRVLRRTGKAGIYRYVATNVAGVVTVWIRTPGGRTVAKGTGKTINAAARRGADEDPRSNESVRLTINATWLPSF